MTCPSTSVAPSKGAFSSFTLFGGEEDASRINPILIAPTIRSAARLMAAEPKQRGMEPPYGTAEDIPAANDGSIELASACVVGEFNGHFSKTGPWRERSAQ